MKKLFSLVSYNVKAISLSSLAFLRRLCRVEKRAWERGGNKKENFEREELLMQGENGKVAKFTNKVTVSYFDTASQQRKLISIPTADIGLALESYLPKVYSRFAINFPY